MNFKFEFTYHKRVVLLKMKKNRSHTFAKSLKGRSSLVTGSLAPSQVLIDELLASYKSRNLELTETLAGSLIHKYPDHPFGWKVLGVLFKITGRLGESLEAMHRCTRLSPNDAEAHNNFGVGLTEAGRLAEAEVSLREAVRLSPNYAEALNNLGIVLRKIGKLRDAEVCYKNALLINPEYIEARFNLGVISQELGCADEATACYYEVIRRKPDFAPAHCNLGNMLRYLGHLNEAEASYRQAIEHRPDMAEAYSNLGLTLQQLERLNEAECNYREAIRLNPNLAEAHNNLGITLSRQNRLYEAFASYQMAVKLNSAYAEAHNNSGVTLQQLGRQVEARDCYRLALTANSNFSEARSNLLFSLNYVDSLSPEEMLDEARRYGAIVSANAKPKFDRWALPSESQSLKIGLVSGDFNNHPVGYFVQELIRLLDKNKFQLYAFPTTPKIDGLTDQIKPFFHDWIPVYGKTDLEASDLIHEQGIQILIDLSGHSAQNRLPIFAYKPSPIQVSWLGYFATTGLPEMDYFLGDPYLAPANEAGHFTEKIWHLAQTWLCSPPSIQRRCVEFPPVVSNQFVTFGCFGNLAKINHSVITCWANILRRVASSKLYLKSNQLSDLRVIADLQAQFAQHGIPADRLVLEGPSSREVYLDAYNKIDMVLDTFPYPGGTTSVNALSMGVPVLTLKGDRFLSHLGESIAINAGQADWIAEDATDYINKAVAFASVLQKNPASRLVLRDRLLKTPLFDTKLFANDFGDALWGMWESNMHKLDCIKS